MTCQHVYTLYRSAGREYLACLRCGALKPSATEYFSDQGEADRKSLEPRE